MDEIDEIWVIYKRNLGQNSRWNINLQLKINFGRWIKNQEQSGRWIAILPLESYLGHQINTGVIWAIRSRCMKEGKYHKKNQRYIDILPPQAIFSKNLRYISPNRYIADILAIFTKISALDFFPRNIVSSLPDTRYIGDISRYFPPCQLVI